MKSSKHSTDSLMRKANRAFDSMKKREQYLLIIAVPATIIVVFFLLLIEPEMKAATKLDGRLSRLQNQLSMVQQSNQELLKQAEIDPNTQIRQQIESLQRRLEQLNQDFQGELNQLVLPQIMPVLLEQLFYKAEGLSLIKMQSLAPDKLIVNRIVDPQSQTNSQSGASNDQPIYRHGIEIIFAGSFFATRDFLAEAENLGWKLYWQDLSYEVGDYPDANTHLTLFTLSTSEAFIGVN